MQEISGVGARLLWKNPQKKARKNITSETIKRTIPNFNLPRTAEV